MSGWSSNGRVVLFEALGAAWDQIDADITKEFHNRQSRESELVLELEKSQARASRISSLEAENSMLKETIEKLKQPELPATVAAVELKDAQNTVQVPSPDLTALEADLGKLRGKYSQLKALYDQSITLLKKRKEEVHEWIAYAESLEAKLKRSQADNEKLGPSDAEPPRAQSFEGQGRVANEEDRLQLPDNTARPLSHVGFISNLSSSFGPERTVDVHITPRRALSQPPGSQVSDRTESLPATSQTDTHNPEDDLEDLPRLPSQANTAKVRVKEEPSSDPPIIVSERAVRKRRNNSPGYPSAVPRRRVKTEDGDSDPSVTEETAYFDPQESMDLDEGQNTLPTPRKRRLLEEHFANKRASLSSASSGQLPTPSRALLARQLLTPSSVLQPISPNRRIIKTAAGKSKEKRSKNFQNAVTILGEDGYSSDAQEKPSDPLPPSTNVGRLNALLNSTSSRPSAIISRPSNRLSRDLSSKRDVDLPPRRALPFPDKNQLQTPQTASSAKHRTPLAPLAQPISVTRSAPPLRRSNENQGPAVPLRQKPLSSMKLDDFKINPKFNDGQNFAFAEVVRNRSEREGLPGCTDMNCCGKYFRAMASAERAGKPSSPPFLNLPDATVLLETYLGEDAFLLGGMTREEKEELWLAARTRELANKYGKHRHRHHRRPSPPGFWNADFPSTQEEARERQEGLKMEQALVQERYREAMRQDGRWLFRDE
ncbi:uncharacterized protein E0L32_005686 [Thyridium curvatum]|uniref:DNA endonuclease activator Ctp1 C-terminal domain-containing protein n=1 Tax=Thyridium curvatum TaxID=1093900 RepID=A0A507B4G9_9PEZI|nr:uncharacterized protein E0L32_005686 [Thyridium curvatum]TPX13986.1 hypothetical protein E0L32_005686 [Thyridium curvatum]